MLLVLSVVVAGYILSHERFRFPFIQASPFTLNAEFSTAQAVTPGQGQSVRVSGVQIGQIGGVTLKNGIADVQMQISQKYKNLIHTNATALLRPKTGLKDMFVEVDPGTKSAPVAKQGFTIPVSNTNPDINVDEILGSLDADTRSYLSLLVNGAGQGLKGNGGTELAQVFERFEPTHRDLARLNRAVAVRGQDLSQLVNSLQRLNTALVPQAGPDRLAGRRQSRRCSTPSPPRTATSAARSPTCRRRCSRPPTTLAKVQTFAKLLGPTATNLLPAARSLPAANAALVALAKPSTPIVQNQIRPFVVAARPLVRKLKPASVNLAKATPEPEQDVHGAQPLGQHARLQPGQDRQRPARLPVVAGLAGPQRPHAVLDPGRQRRVPPAVPAGQLRHPRPADRQPQRRRRGPWHGDRGPVEPHADRRQRGHLPQQATAVTAAYQKYAAAHPNAASQVANVAPAAPPTATSPP